MLDFLHMYQDSKLFILYHFIFHNWSQDSKKTHKQIIEGQVEFKACLKKIVHCKPYAIKVHI